VPADVRSKLPGRPGGDASDAHIDAYGAESVEISANMQSPGFLVLSDTYYPAGMHTLMERGQRYSRRTMSSALFFWIREFIKLNSLMNPSHSSVVLRSASALCSVRADFPCDMDQDKKAERWKEW